MHSSLLSKYDTNKSVKYTIDILTWIFRIITGGTFIISGFVKAIDPWGTFYKFAEYSHVMGVPVLKSLILTGVFALCAFEFIIGVSLLTGSYRKSSPIAALCFMCVMLPLTLWIAISNPVKDCGCFGEFLILSNWQTFWKNIILLMLIIWLIKFNKDEVTIISPAFQWLQIVFSILYVGSVMIYGYFVQPMLDFRPYPEGDVLVNEEDSDYSDDNYVFIYERNGERKEFSINDELPSEDDGWTFIERKELPFQNKNTPELKTFRIWDKSGNNDETENVLTEADKLMLLLIPELESVSPSTTWKINSLYDLSSKSDINMIAVVSGTTDQIEEWEDLSMPQYDIYTSDDTTIKEIARGNPALVYIENDTIKWKSTLNALDIEEPEKTRNFDANSLRVDSKNVLLNISLLYLICIAVLIALSMMPRIKDKYFKTSDKAHKTVKFTDDDKAHP